MNKRVWVLSIAGAALAGCGVDARPAFRDVDATAYERIGHHVQWNRGTEDDQRADAAARALLAKELSAEGAVEIALLNNHELQATFEEIGIAQADLVQAGLLRNPEFAASWRLPDRAPRQTDAEYAISEDFLDLLILPLRKKVAAAELERTKARVGDAVLTLAAEVKTAFYTVQASGELVERLRVIAEANGTSAELAERQHAAGTLNDLELANQQSVAAQAQLDVAAAELEITVARERLTRLLGLEGSAAREWKTEPHLSEVRGSEAAEAELEETALRQRLDLAASKQAVAALARAVGVTEDFRYLTAVKVGVDTEHNPGGPNVTGPTIDLELPVFDQGQARVAVMRGQYRQARERLLQQTIEVRSEVREAYARLTAERALAVTYRDTLLPQRANILHLTQLHYNAMLKGSYDLLLAKQNEVVAERGAIAAARDYWIASAELERAVGGRLPESK